MARYLAWLEAERGLRFDDYQSLWSWSVDQPRDFWDSIWHFFQVNSSTPYTEVLSADPMPRQRWFTGAHVNYAEHVLDRVAGKDVAVITVDEGQPAVHLSGDELRGQVGALAAMLRDAGVRTGDRVAGYLPNNAAALVSMLAATSLGAVWTCCAPDFGMRSVSDRLGQAEPKVLIGIDGYQFNGKTHDRRDTVTTLSKELTSLTCTIIVRSAWPRDTSLLHDGWLAFDEVVAEPVEPTFAATRFEDPLWILFSSGTTGPPKGIVHSHGGILVEQLKSLGLCMDLGPSDRYFFHSSTSWMAWNFLVGGLLHGSAVVLYNGSPSYQSPDALWRVATETGATVLGMGAAYAAGCAKAAVRLEDVGDLSALRTLIPTGSPLPLGGWHWLTEQLPAGVRIDALCGGTDVCTAFFGGSRLLPVRLGEISCRWLGIDARAFDAEGRPLVGKVGEFVLTTPMPSMPVAFWNDPDGSRYESSYLDLYPGVWRQGDWIKIEADGAVVVYGRSDATLNRGGVRIGSAEIYSVVENAPEIADSLVIGVELPSGDYYLPLFVVAAPGQTIDDAARERLVRTIRAELSPRHVPDEIHVVSGLPRTLTGKKLEIPVKRILQGLPVEQAAAVGSIDRPELMQWFADFAALRRREGEQDVRRNVRGANSTFGDPVDPQWSKPDDQRGGTSGVG